MVKKSMRVQLNSEDIKTLDKLKKIFNEKTKSKTIRKIIRLSKDRFI